MCSDLYKPLKNKQLNKIANYYKLDSVNQSLIFKNFSGWPLGPPPPPPDGGDDPLPHLPPFGAMCLSETYGFI